MHAVITEKNKTTVIWGKSATNANYYRKKTSFECYVYVDNQFYPVSTPLRAVDITFKIIHILNALYPTEAEQIWLLLHKAVYKLDTAWDKQFTCVMSLLSYYKGLLL